MSYTASDIINMTLRSFGVLAEGETPSADTSADALMALNMMIDSWSTERLSCYTTQDQDFTWAAAASSKTLGLSGADFTGNRPVWIDPATYFVVDGISYQIQLVNQAQYNSIVLKSSTSPYPQVLYAEMGNPNITMYLYPVPTGAITIHIISVLELSQPASLATTLAFPPGYMRAFWSNLCREIAAQFGVGCPSDIRNIATTSKRNIQKVNNPGDVMSMPSPLVSRAYGRNVYSGWM